MPIESSDAADVTWGSKTYPEILDIAERDGSVLVVPVGSLEQHGHHLPVATDTILVDAVATAGAQRVADSVPILVTPPVWTGFSPHHMDFGGTVTLDHDTLLDTLEGIADAALDNGFDALLLLNGHGGNASLIGSATGTIGAAHPDVEVLGLTYFRLAASFIDDIRDSELGGMSHGGEFETSLMLHLRPGAVRDLDGDVPNKEQLYPQTGVDLTAGGPLSVYKSFAEYSDSGAVGAPDLATAEKGERIYEHLGDEMEALLARIHERTR